VRPQHDDFADLLRTAQAIADYTEQPYRKTVYQLERGYLPGWKVGAHWHSTKSKIRARLLGEDGGA
jgi:hypothetical protein